MSHEARHPVSHREALARLREGNARFVRGVVGIDALATRARREALADGQSPFAVILSCADSRVPSEMVFDCGLGDLFVVRVAGNVVAPSLVGSIEFATSTFGTELVVVLGHSRCGAVGATIDALTHGTGAPSPNVRDLVDRIAPGIRDCIEHGGASTDVLSRAIRANVRASVHHLRHSSAILESRIADSRLRVVGAEYDLASGVVTFFDGLEDGEVDAAEAEQTGRSELLKVSAPASA